MSTPRTTSAGTRIEPVRHEMPSRTRDEEAAIRSRVAVKARLSSLVLGDLDEEEKITLSLLPSVGSQTGMARLLELRRRAYATHVAAMQAIPAQLREALAVLESSYGLKVQMWAQQLPWLEALMVARYGEEPSVWPAEFDSNDTMRAVEWVISNKWPNGARPIPPVVTGESGRIRIGALLVLALVVLVGLASFVDPRALFGFVIVGTALSNFWENELIDHLFRARSYTAPTDHYIALYTAAPGETGGGTEVSGGSYARVQVAAGFANWLGTGGETTAADSAGTGGQTSNRNAITFPAPTGNWGQVTHFSSYDASTSGNEYFYGALTTAKTVNNGDPAPAFAAGALTFTLA